MVRGELLHDIRLAVSRVGNHNWRRVWKAANPFGDILNVVSNVRTQRIVNQNSDAELSVDWTPLRNLPALPCLVDLYLVFLDRWGRSVVLAFSRYGHCDRNALDCT